MARTPEPDYLTSAEGARVLGVSPKTLNRWADAGLVPIIVTLGGHRRFERDDLEKVAVRERAVKVRRTDLVRLVLRDKSCGSGKLVIY